MLVRDRDIGAIIQHPLDKNSGGDSARSTGMMALFGSLEDQLILGRFEVPPLRGTICRHPLLWPTTDDFTRDQLLCFLGGCWKARRTDLARRIFWSHAKRGFLCQNYMEQFPNAKTGVRRNKGFFGRDPLSPSHIGYIIICARLWFLFPFLLVAFPWFLVDLWYATKVRPREEQNQIIAMASAYGCLKLWAQWHPCWDRPIMEYWGALGGWRDQREISEFIVNGIQSEIR